jgi:hypothetical protein
MTSSSKGRFAPPARRSDQRTKSNEVLPQSGHIVPDPFPQFPQYFAPHFLHFLTKLAEELVFPQLGQVSFAIVYPSFPPERSSIRG